MFVLEGKFSGLFMSRQPLANAVTGNLFDFFLFFFWCWEGLARVIFTSLVVFLSHVLPLSFRLLFVIVFVVTKKMAIV